MGKQIFIGDGFYAEYNSTDTTLREKRRNPPIQYNQGITSDMHPAQVAARDALATSVLFGLRPPSQSTNYPRDQRTYTSYIESLA